MVSERAEVSSSAVAAACWMPAWHCISPGFIYFSGLHLFLQNPGACQEAAARRCQRTRVKAWEEFSRAVASLCPLPWHFFHEIFNPSVVIPLARRTRGTVTGPSPPVVPPGASASPSNAQNGGARARPARSSGRLRARDSRSQEAPRAGERRRGKGPREGIYLRGGGRR